MRLSHALFLAATSSVVAASATATPLRFSLIVNCPGSREHLCGETMILARGDITIDSGSDLRTFLAKNAKLLRREEVRFVVFDSPGGSLIGGMDLGNAIRRAQLDTHLAVQIVGETFGTKPARVEIDSAICASACSLAFLGGNKRDSIYWSGKVGVHQFSSAVGQIGDSATQVTVTMIARYIDMMGVNRGLLDIASMVPPKKIHWLTKEQQLRLSVDNVQALAPIWQLTAWPDGTTVAEITQKFPTRGTSCTAEIFSVNGQPTLLWTYRPKGGMVDAKDALSRFKDSPLWFQIDADKPLGELSGKLWRVTDDGALGATIDLPRLVVQRILRAKSLSVEVPASMADNHLDPSCSFETTDGLNLIRAAVK